APPPVVWGCFRVRAPTPTAPNPCPPRTCSGPCGSGPTHCRVFTDPTATPTVSSRRSTENGCSPTHFGTLSPNATPMPAPPSIPSKNYLATTQYAPHSATTGSPPNAPATPKTGWGRCRSTPADTGYGPARPP